MEIAVRFNSGKRDLVATVVRPGVKGVLTLNTPAEKDRFRKANGENGSDLRLKEKEIPSQVDLSEADSGALTQLEAGEDGPPVCYWVRGALVCW